MEHAILIEIIGKVTPVLEEYDIVLDICIDGDLNSNRTLGEQQIVHRIVADLKHKAKLVRTKIGMNFLNSFFGFIVNIKYRIRDDIFYFN